MAKLGSIKYQVTQHIKEIISMNESKAEYRELSDIIGENGHKQVDKLFSGDNTEKYRNELLDLGNFAKENHNIKDMSKIDISIVKDWIDNKDIVYRTASNYLSHINMAGQNNFINVSRDEVKEYRQELKADVKSGKMQKQGEVANNTRYYKNVDKVVLKDQYMAAFELQRDYGLRETASRSIVIEKQLHGNTLSFREKGGNWSTRELKPDLVARIKEHAKNGVYLVNEKTLARNIQKGVEAVGNEWNGMHGMRHTYAQDRLDQGESKSEVSEELGHVRESSTDTYLR